MQGLKLRVHPAAWKRWRTLVPSHSNRRGPPILAGPQLGAGSGKGQKPAMARWPSRGIKRERGGPPIKSHRLAYGIRLMRPVAG